MSRSSPNCSVMRTEPTDELDVISVTLAIWPRWRSSGVATVVATTCGLAPGSCACTEMVGKSTCGSGDTGSWKNEMAPAAATPKVSSVVATGRRMNGVEMLMAHSRRRAFGTRRGRGAGPGEAGGQAVEPQIDHGRGEQREDLAHQQSADDRDAKRMAQLRAHSGADHQGQGAEDRRHRGHQDRTKAQQAGLIDRIARRAAMV